MTWGRIDDRQCMNTVGGQFPAITRWGQGRLYSPPAPISHRFRPSRFTATRFWWLPWTVQGFAGGAKLFISYVGDGRAFLAMPWMRLQTYITCWLVGCVHIGGSTDAAVTWRHDGGTNGRAAGGRAGGPMGDLVISQRCMCVALAPAPGCSRLDDDLCAAGHRHLTVKLAPSATAAASRRAASCTHRLAQRATCTCVVDGCRWQRVGRFAVGGCARDRIG